MKLRDPFHYYREIWLVDFEFHQPDGERPTVICMVAREFRTGRTIRAWADELVKMPAPPFPVDPGAIFVAYFVSAELSCFLALAWDMPARILDLFTEFRCATNGLGTIAGNGLLGAMANHGLSSIDVAEKTSMRDLAIRGGPYTDDERQALLDYCESDVVSLAKLLPAMAPKIDLPRALLRGRYMAAVAHMEWNGIPVDQEALDALRDQWDTIKSRLIHRVDSDYRVYVPTGQRPINPSSKFGAAVLQEAAEWEIDPHDLVLAAGEVLTEAEQQTGDFREAVAVARKATGLTVRKISRWENSGRDYSSWPALDVKARELAGELPELGLGRGYVDGETYDDMDYAARLWELLSEDTDRPLRKWNPEILTEAAARVADGADHVRIGQWSFSTARFAEWLVRNGIPWPRLESGALKLDDDTFRQMSKAYTAVAPLRELRHTLGELRLESLAVGSDGRNRCLLSPFRSRTGRNQPSNSRFIFGPSCWLRGLVKPDVGRAVAYVDWSQQEFAIAAKLSNDPAMMDAYLSHDCYLTFAKQAGAVPQDATKQSHPAERELFKTCALAVQYGMGEQSLAERLGKPPIVARELLKAHRRTYPRYWTWSESAVDHAMLHGWLPTVFGWTIHVGPQANPRSLANFLMQANGAEMLRLACCLATERGIQVCAPIHDALLVEGSTDSIDDVVAQTQEAMAEASRIVLDDGFELRSDAKIVSWPNRYMDPRGRTMWDTVMGLLTEDNLAQAGIGDLAQAGIGT